MVKKNTVTQVAITEEQVKEKLCGCGCGEPVNPKRSYKAGHDARHHSALLRAYDSGDKDAVALLLAKGWAIEQKLQERDEKAAKRAQKATKAQVPTTGAEVKEGTTENAGEVSG